MLKSLRRSGSLCGKKNMLFRAANCLSEFAKERKQFIELQRRWGRMDWTNSAFSLSPLTQPDRLQMSHSPALYKFNIPLYFHILTASHSFFLSYLIFSNCPINSSTNNSGLNPSEMFLHPNLSLFMIFFFVYVSNEPHSIPLDIIWFHSSMCALNQFIAYLLLHLIRTIVCGA